MQPDMYTAPAPTPAGLAALLGRLALGRDEAAWQHLLSDIGPDMLRLARRLSGNGGLAEDAVQESLLQIRDHAGRFSPRGDDPDAEARRWILRLTANTALHLLRGRRRTAARHQRAAQEQPTMTDGGPHADLERTEQADLLRQALTHLSEPSRTAVILHHCAGLGYEAVAAELRVPVGTAKTHVHRGLERLRRHLMRLGCTLSLTALVGALDSLAAAENATGSMAAHAGLIHSTHHASVLALPSSGGLSMATLIGGSIAAILTTTITLSLLSGADGTGPAGAGAGDAAPVDMTKKPPVAAAPSNPVTQKLSVDFVDTSPADALAFISQITALPIVMDPQLDAATLVPVTLKVSDMELQHVLSFIAKLTDTAIILHDGKLVIRPSNGNPGFSVARPAGT